MTILNNNICKKPTKNLIFYEIIQFKKDHYKKYCFHENNRKSFNLELNDILMVTNQSTIKLMSFKW